MAHEAKRIFRSREQTPQQQAEERAVRERFQREKPSLEKLIADGDAAFVTTVGEYCDWLKTVGRLQHMREQQGLSVEEISRRVGIDATTIRQIEGGEPNELTFKAVASYAHALGQRLVIDLAQAS